MKIWHFRDGDNMQLPKDPSRAISRREWLAAISATAFLGRRVQPVSSATAGPLKISVFSKHFQWTNCQEMAAIAKDAGFDGIDLTVRERGHVLPERVEEDLPKAAEAIRKAGLELPMITAGIVDTRSPHAEAILKTTSRLGIRYYRWGGFLYSASKSVPDQLAEFKTRTKDLADLNKEYDVCAMYHTHSGIDRVGASIWDLWYILKDFDSRYVGVNYDIGHATVEGGYGGWISSTRITAPMMCGVAVKDFRWGISPKGQWQPLWCQPGQGMVDFTKFFTMLKAARFSGPFQLHYEYPELGGADAGETKLSISKETFISILRRDLAYMRDQLKQAQLL
jgi:sugar phosphate isomerase/epimerase